ncbi:MAG: YicC/YloC family endoribonuclease [Gammaproteobacteria bacterium]|jgi:uncharacterized protein (TIGR00255 family)
MPNSMTGFASHAVVAGTYEFTWEIRSVNHRFLDVSLRLPEEWRRIETACREVAGQYVRRGKLDCTLRAAPNPRAVLEARLDEDMLADLRALQEQVWKFLPDARPLSVAEALRFDGVMVDPRHTDAAGSTDQVLLEALSGAFAALVTARRSEGDRIAQFLLQRVTAIETAVEQAQPLLPAAAEKYRTRLLSRIEQLNIEAQPERLEQELAMIAQRLDITEELDRLRSHTVEIREILTRDEPIGRRLDFLIQELNREANTMSSKSQDEDLTRIAVDMKVAIEQMREQVQNLE